MPPSLTGPKARVEVSIFLPWVAATKDLGELHHLGCWPSKQANRTSRTLSELLRDEETTRQAILQNKAATDFLLLVHGHGCQDFKALTCPTILSPSHRATHC